jgi:hypothetical protein
LVPAALLAGCGSSSGGGNGAAGIVPASAAAYIAVDTDRGSSQWKAADALAGRFPDKAKAIASVERSAKNEGIDVKRDVEPALGSEVDIAWLDFENGGQDVVVLLKPDDTDAFKRIVARGNAKDPTSKVVYETVGDWEALADSKAVLDRFSRLSSAGGPMLADDAAFKGAMKAVSQDSLFRAYVNGTEVMKAIRGQGNATVDKLLGKVGKLDWLVAGVGAASDGIRFDTVVRGTPGKALHGNGGETAFKPSLPDTVPGDALLYLSFHGSKGMFGSLEKLPQLDTDNLRPVSKLLQSLGTLLQGENAIYVRNPPAGKKLPEITLVADPGTGEDAAATLDRALAQKSLKLGKEPKAETIGGIAARSLDLGPVSIVYADIGNRLVVTDGASGIEAAAHPATTLSGSKDFSDASTQAGLPANTQGFLYVNVTGGLALGQRLASAPIPASVKRDLKPLRSAIEYGVTRPSEIQVTFFLRIT